ncbi:EVE domain-containing protein [Hydrogenophaga crassostreae]|uniref:EVE domain-containing protein n=1 Tax=Hydrogenophaga crassostreae TaxID=1763535 RepID=UPI002EDA42E6
MDTRASDMSLPRCWIAVACAEHASHGREQGFMQVCHGKAGPLRRLRAGDWVACYAPARTMGGKDRLQSFVSLGVVQTGAPYAIDMGGGFVPHRLDLRYVEARPAPIAPLLDALDFVEDRQRWGHRFRFGLFEVSSADLRCIGRAMGAVEGPVAHGHGVGSGQAPHISTLPMF